jgi:hypothetical protein
MAPRLFISPRRNPSRPHWWSAWKFLLITCRVFRLLSSDLVSSMIPLVYTCNIQTGLPVLCDFVISREAIISVLQLVLVQLSFKTFLLAHGFIGLMPAVQSCRTTEHSVRFLRCTMADVFKFLRRKSRAVMLTVGTVERFAIHAPAMCHSSATYLW